MEDQLNGWVNKFMYLLSGLVCTVCQVISKHVQHQVHLRRCNNVTLMMARRRRRRANIKAK